MLKETLTSLRAYFVLITLMALLPVAAQFNNAAFDVGTTVVGITFGGLYAFVAFRMDYLLTKRPGFIRGVLLFNLAISVLVAAFGALSGNVWSTLPYLALAIAITAYLYSNVRRLSLAATVASSSDQVTRDSSKNA